MSVLLGLLPLLPLLFRKELKFSWRVSLLDLWSELWLSYPVDWLGFFHARLVGIFPGSSIWGGINAPMVLPPDLLSRVIATFSKRCPAGAVAELLDGTLKLRHFTRPFGQHSPTWSFPGYQHLGSRDNLGEREGGASGFRGEGDGTVVLKVRGVHSRPEPGAPTPK